MSKQWPKDQFFLGLIKIFHSYILFLLEYKSSYCVPTLCFIWEVSDS